MLDIPQIKKVVKKVGKKYGIKSAYLFGSYAKGTANNKSDIDILFERGNIKTYDAYYDFREELISELGTEIDLLAADGVKPRFYEMIKNDRILIYGA